MKKNAKIKMESITQQIAFHDHEIWKHNERIKKLQKEFETAAREYQAEIEAENIQRGVMAY